MTSIDLSEKLGVAHSELGAMIESNNVFNLQPIVFEDKESRLRKKYFLTDAQSKYYGDMYNDNYIIDSIELSKKIGKEHRNLVRDIDKMLENIYQGGVLKFEHTLIGIKISYYIHNQNNQRYRKYELSKKGLLFVASKYDDVMRLKIINLIDSYEKRLSVPSNYLEAMKECVRLEEERLRLESKIEHDRYKVDFADTVASIDDSITITEFSSIVSKELCIKINDMFDILKKMDLLTKADSKYRATAKAIYQGLLENRERVYRKDGENKISIQARVLLKNQNKLIQKIKNYIGA